jgi:phospholipase D1/2
VSSLFSRRLDEAVLVRTRSSITNFQLQFPHTSWTLTLSTEEEADAWVKAICMNTPTQFYRYLSFSPVRHRTSAELYVDGVSMFPAVATALRSARHEIFITGWSVNPELYVCDRNRPVSPADRLDHMLLERATQGVRIYVLVWRETKIALGGTIHSEYTKRTLQALHPNIHVMRHPLRIPVLWSHHQKIIVVDQVHVRVVCVCVCVCVCVF